MFDIRSESHFQKYNFLNSIYEHECTEYPLLKSTKFWDAPKTLMKIETWHLRGSELPHPDWRERISSTFEGCRHQSEWPTDWTGRIFDRFVRKRPSRQCRPRTRICFPENLKLHLEYFSWERNDTNHHLKLHITKKYSE